MRKTSLEVKQHVATSESLNTSHQREMNEFFHKQKDSDSSNWESELIDYLTFYIGKGEVFLLQTCMDTLETCQHM